MTQLTDELNSLVAAFVTARDKEGSYAGADEAYKLAEFCADIFERPFTVRSEDRTRAIRLPHISSQDAYRETWRKEGHNVITGTTRLAVAQVSHGWYTALDTTAPQR